MVDQIDVVKFTTPAAPGTLDITSPNITEAFSAAILIFTRQTADDSNEPHGVLGIGFIGADGTQLGLTLQVAVCATIEGGEDIGQLCATARDTATAFRAPDGLGGLDIVADYDAAIAGGFRLDFTQTDVQATCTAIIFAGLTEAAVGSCTHNDGGSTHEDVGESPFFEPDLVVFRSSDNVLTSDTLNATMALGFALNIAGIPQVSAYLNWDNGADPTDSDGFYRSDACSSAFIGDRLVAMDRFGITSFDSTGWNAIAVDTGGSNSPQANYLALKFSGAVRLACANLAVAASTGDQTFNSFGFTPDLVLGMSHLMTAVDTLTDGATASAGGLFVTGRYGSRAYSIRNEEGLNLNPAVSNAHTRQGDHAVLALDHLGNVVQQASWVGASGSGGFILNFSTASQAGTLTALGIQLIPNPPLVPRRARRERAVRQALRRRPPTVFGVPVQVSAPPLSRFFWKAIQRIRMAMVRRRRRTEPVLSTIPPVGAPSSEPSTLRVFTSGMERGRTVSGEPTTELRTFTPGTERGRVSGGGVPFDDPE